MAQRVEAAGHEDRRKHGTSEGTNHRHNSILPFLLPGKSSTTATSSPPRTDRPPMRSWINASRSHGTPDHVYVYGRTAAYTDFTHVLSSKMPYFIGAVVLLSYLLPTIAFPQPARAAHHGTDEPLRRGSVVRHHRRNLPVGLGRGGAGHRQGGPIEAFAPVLYFAILFGLSIDYQVFLVSRTQKSGAHEEQPAGHHHRPAGDRRDHHRRGDHHDRGVQPVRPRR
jgi:hypothetical protein